MGIGANEELWIGSPLLDGDGRRLGTIEELYRHEQTGRPQWVVVRTGRFRSARRFVPLHGAKRTPDGVTTPFARALIAAAPQLRVDERLRDQDVIELYRHYGLPHDTLADGDRPEPQSPAQRVIGYLEKSERP